MIQRRSRERNVRHQDQVLNKKKPESKNRRFEGRPFQSQGQEWLRLRTKDTIFLKIMVGQISIIFKSESVQNFAFCLVFDDNSKIVVIKKITNVVLKFYVFAEC